MCTTHSGNFSFKLFVHSICFVSSLLWGGLYVDGYKASICHWVFGWKRCLCMVFEWRLVCRVVCPTFAVPIKKCLGFLGSL